MSVSKTIKFQNQSCCDGAIIYGAAWDYKAQPGDGAKAGGAANNADASWSPNITTTGTWSAGENIFGDAFKSTSIDLCVYKANGNSGNSTDWANAVNHCADGTYADGDNTVGWYLPNQMELQSIYKAIGGNGSSKIDFTVLDGTTGLIATTAENMISSGYWSSTEYSATDGLNLWFANGNRSENIKPGGSRYVRCVRRL